MYIFRRERGRRKLRSRQTDIFAYIILFPKQALFSAKRNSLALKSSPCWERKIRVSDQHT